MAFISSIALAPPPFTYTQAEVYQVLVQYYPENFRKKFDIQEIFKNSQVQNRSFIVSLPELAKLGSFEERNKLYLERGAELSQHAIQDCLQQSKTKASEIDTILMVSSTGFVVPSLETHLIHSVGFSPQVQRIPIVGWGCTGGVAGLNTALSLAKGNPKSKIMLINLELCSLAFQEKDLSPKSVIANAIFNDGACAALIVGKDVLEKPNDSIEILGSHRHLFPKTFHFMGWEQLPSGLQVILSPEIPELIRKESLSFFTSWLESKKLSWEDIKLWLFHPGGAKILQALTESLNLSEEESELSWKNLRENGNISSCSIMYGLQKILKNNSLQGLGLASAFGPGFTAEALLFKKTF